jgi:hypothetical protein
MSKCKGNAKCTTDDNQSGVTILCVMEGTVESKTKGINGPATIDCVATTKYLATKRILFEGCAFKSEPAEVECCSELQIIGVGSKLPRLRGSIVKTIAARKSEELRPKAEEIIEALTKQELSERIDKEINAQLAELNQYLQLVETLLCPVPVKYREITISSSKEGVTFHYNTARLLLSVGQ